MAACPKCTNELFYLDRLINQRSVYEFHGAEDADLTDSGVESDEFHCPDCGARLFTSEKEAVEFLSGPQEGE